MVKNLFICSVSLLALFTLLSVAITRQEKYECLKWQAQADITPGIQFAPWQFAQCDAYHISI